MLAARRAAAASFALLGLLHCGGDATGAGDAADGGAGGTTSGDAAANANASAPPAHHRPASVACTTPRPPGSAPDISGSTCKADTDCAEGKNGRCVFGPNLAAVCSYDECGVDADCGSGVCDCRNEAHASANVCFRGNCVTDDDCGSGGYCSPSGTNLFSNCRRNVPAGAFGYFCHTANDACREDGDCGTDASCIFLPERGQWACLQRLCTKGGGE